MKKAISAFFILSLVLFVNAKPGNSVGIPEHAQEVAPGLYKLQKTADGLEGFMIVHKKNFVKPSGVGGGKKSSGPACYGFLASGAKWKSAEPFLINPSNTQELDAAFLKNNMDVNIGKWETAAGENIIGPSSLTNAALVADTAAPDGVNEVYFGSIDDPGTIAVTIVWGYFSGPPKMRELVEWDQVFDQEDYAWSSSGEAGKMDFNNIDTHELGHTFGLNDQYDAACADVTMYGYAGLGETNKQTLEAQDMKGVSTLYK